MTDLINRTELIASLEETKRIRGKLNQNDYREAIEKAPAITTSGHAWVTERMPEKPIETFVRVQQGSTVMIMLAKYRPSGFFNGGLNKWSVEQVVGINAGCKVIAWLDPPKE